MKQFILFQIFVFSVLGSCAQTITQDVISSDGGYHKQNIGSFQYTVGELVSETFADSTGKMTLGFQQGNYNVVFVNEISIENISAVIFPNPTSDYITIHITTENANEKYQMQIFDMNGKIVKSEEIASNSSIKYDLNSIAEANYLIVLKSVSGLYSKTYKIQKIK